ncbi:hypothetical protein V6N13_144570 [Hibiscus sabdariffa]|uniref:Uncharacterized protein n=2 Tax=Hibiscus sabdariffa TaxID=183260 RepID=A0ABR1ZF42_9ROSI
MSREKRCNTNRSKVWLLSLCSRDSSDGENVEANNVPSLGHFLAVERSVTDEYRRNNQSPTTTVYGPDEFASAQPNFEPNSLFVNGSIAPPRTSCCLGTADDNNYGVPLLFSCMCGQLSL